MNEPKVINADCLEALRAMEDCSVDAVVTDPPYGLSNTKPAQVAEILRRWVTGDVEHVPEKRGGFMGQDWDSFVPPPAVWVECMRVLKPGGHMVVFAGARTQDLMGLSIRLAGFEIRDTLGWIYGSGFPKSMDVSKAIDKAAGAEREVVGRRTGAQSESTGRYGAWGNDRGDGTSEFDITTPASDAAKQWDGWGTALKPAIEPIILARKPVVGTVAQNVLEHGTGAVNIDGCRVGDFGGGRFPANVLLDEHAAEELDKQSGVLKSGERKPKQTPKVQGSCFGKYKQNCINHFPNDSGGASRFFPVFKYQAKAPKKERPVIVREDGKKIQHPTVKPLTLLEWLVTLITQPGGTVLDPFAGTGTTLQAARNKGFNSIGIEANADYIELINQRIA